MSYVQYNCSMINGSQKQNTPRLFLCKLAKAEGKVYPPERQAEIDKCSHPIARLEKYTSWQLLKYAVEKSFGVPFEMFDFTKNRNGKWQSEGIFFSISHSDGVCAVVVHNAPIGIDVQLHQPNRFDLPLLNRIATNNEWIELVGKTPTIAEKTSGALTNQIESHQILSLWCKKEALFKKLDMPNLTLAKIDTTTINFVEFVVTFDDKRYHVAVATNHPTVDTEWVEI